ncbi:MAG: transporter permease subunit [Bacteroidetes bacterium]|nr:transporter permease subunit [Bacteroidota bacterium]
MNFFKSLFTPFARVSNRNYTFLIIIDCAIALLLWQVFAAGGLIPTPGRIAGSVLRIVSTDDFFDNLFSSLTLTLKGMFYSIIIALVICYLSVVPIFTPVARFIIKCRYLTLTGLIFLFTLLTSNGHNLKMSLLIFGIVPFFVTSLLSIIDAINEQEYELCKTLKMNNWQTLLEVVIIGKLDQVLEVMRQNFAIAWMMITMVEGLNMSEGGLGTLLIKSNKYIDLGTVFAILVLIFAMGVFFDLLLAKLRTWFFPYTKLQIRK